MLWNTWGVSQGGLGEPEGGQAGRKEWKGEKMACTSLQMASQTCFPSPMVLPVSHWYIAYCTSYCTSMNVALKGDFFNVSFYSPATNSHTFALNAPAGPVRSVRMMVFPSSTCLNLYHHHSHLCRWDPSLLRSDLCKHCFTVCATLLVVGGVEDGRATLKYSLRLLNFPFLEVAAQPPMVIKYPTG